MNARFALLGLLLSHAACHAEVGDCFTIYNAANEPVLRSTRTPVDLSKPISVEMKRKFPGYHLVWTRNEEPCRPLVIAANGESASRDLEQMAQALDEGSGELLVDGVFTAPAAGRKTAAAADAAEMAAPAAAVRRTRQKVAARQQ